MRPINEQGWILIQATPAFARAPMDSPQVLWRWVQKQDAILQRVVWFLFRMADAMERADDLPGFDKVGSCFDPDRISILPKETRALLAEFVLDPMRYIR